MQRSDEFRTEAMSLPPAVELRDVRFTYPGQSAPTVEDVSFRVARGESVSMIGPNGGGKTTLLRLMLGLLHPTAGEVRVLGERPERARLRIGYMPQYTRHDLQFPVNVMDVALMGRLGAGGTARWLGWYGRADRRAVAEALDRVAMGPLARRPYAALSGGQRQRVLIARALCARPDVLLLDEPTANVDAVVETQLLDVLRELARSMTIVMVSHDLGFVSDMAQRVLCVNRRVVAHPTSRLTGESIQEVYQRSLCLVHHAERVAQEPEQP
ncbi:MAG: ABC transporter ATP-binding protein [Pirellulales bacterium]|nr:ABC transporter ATP-binding protein [Pirellulales bacterium]